MKSYEFNKFRLRELRIETGETTYELAKIFGVSQPTVARWESGKIFPSRNNVGKIAKHFKVSTDYLIGVTDERSNPNNLNKNDPKEKLISEIYNNLNKLDENQLKLVLNLISNIVKD